MDPLQKCPVCGYSLECLPEKHKCPECGFEYDKQMRVFDQSPKLAILLGSLIAIIVLLTVSDPRGVGTPWGILNLVFMSWWSVWYVSRYSFKKRNRGIVAPDAILFLGGGGIVERIPQSDIADVRLKARSAEIHFLSLHKPFSIGDEFFGSHRRLREFCVCAQRVYALPPPAGEPTEDPMGETT